MERSNQLWLQHLRSNGKEQEQALSDLRSSLLAALRKSFRDHSADGFLEDMLQESVLKVLEKLDQFEGRSRFTSWAVSIAIRTTLSELRRLRWKDVSWEELLEEAKFMPAAAVNTELDPENQAQQKLLLDKIKQIVDTELTTKQRDALLLELKGVGQADIAERSKNSRAALYKLTHDARKKLKGSLERGGYSIEDIWESFK